CREAAVRLRIWALPEGIAPPSPIYTCLAVDRGISPDRVSSEVVRPPRSLTGRTLPCPRNLGNPLYLRITSVAPRRPTALREPPQCPIPGQHPLEQPGVRPKPPRPPARGRSRSRSGSGPRCRPGEWSRPPAGHRPPAR